MSHSVVTTRGRITIPAGIRKKLGVKAQDRVTFTKLADGTVLMGSKTRSLMDVTGMHKLPEGLERASVDGTRIGGDRRLRLANLAAASSS